jgi:hypothetical protein
MTNNKLDDDDDDGSGSGGGSGEEEKQELTYGRLLTCRMSELILDGVKQIKVLHLEYVL